jgi:two-component system, LytTR family, sensor kinase
MKMLFKLNYFFESLIVSILVGWIIPLIYILGAFFNNQPIDKQNVIDGVVFSFSVTFCIYYINIQIVKKIQKNEKKFYSQFSRLFFELALTIIISIIVMTIVFKVYLLITNFQAASKNVALYNNIIIAIIVNLIAVSIIEMLFFINKWKKSIIEAEQLKRQNVEIQYAALASQVNPHFLFNSLNALNSLIQNDPAKALIFNREFAKIYRYVLDSKDKLVVTLQDELTFLNSYLYLQKIRFDKALQSQIEINYNCMDYYLPPLSLQLLVENSIKHNEISEEKPLKIKISGEGMELKVVNNYQPLEGASRCGGIGIKNLIERYSHYTDIIPEFKIENNEYIARIPLLKDE